MREITLELDEVSLPGLLAVPEDAAGLVVFAHGSGSSRHSPRNQQVAAGLNDAGRATLLFDLLTEAEGRDRRNVFDIDLLARRVAVALDGVVDRPGLREEPVGLFGASTGAAAALEAARLRPGRVRAVVSRGGRVDMADQPESVELPVLLIVGGADDAVLDLNRRAAQGLPDAELEVVEGAGHLFQGPGELERVTALASDWFAAHLAPGPGTGRQ